MTNINQTLIGTAFDSVQSRSGQLQAVIKTVGIQGPLGLRSHEVNLDDIDGVHAVNLRGSRIVNTASLTRIQPQGCGPIAHVASIGSKDANPGTISYSTTEARLIDVFKAQGMGYARVGITINAVVPAAIQTPFIDTQPADLGANMNEKIPIGRGGNFDEVVGLLVRMISPSCSFNTGFAFEVSGQHATH